MLHDDPVLLKGSVGPPPYYLRTEGSGEFQTARPVLNVWPQCASRFCFTDQFLITFTDTLTIIQFWATTDQAV